MIKKILIVDDSPISRRMLKSCIPKDRGYELFEAGDGLAGLEAYKEIKPDLTFMDLTMPVMDGIQATEAIIAHDSDAIVVVNSADIQIQSINKVMSVGAFLMIKKPPSAESITNAIANVEEKLGG